MPKAIPSTGRQMQARLATDNPSDRRIRKKLIRPKPYHERDLGMLVQGNNELNSYMRRTEDMNLDTVTEGIFSKLLKKKKKGLSHDYSAKVRRQQYKAFVDRYAAAYDSKAGKYKGEKVKEEFIEALIQEITINNSNVGSSNRSDYGGGSSKLSGGFGTQGSSTSRFGGGSGGTSAVMGGVRSGTSGAGRAGGGFGTRGTSPSRFAAKTGGGRFGGGDTRNVGRPSPGSTRPGQRTSPAKPNAVRRPPNSPGMTGRGGAGGRSVYGGNRQYSGSSNSRYGNRGTRPSTGSANPSGNQTAWWKR